MTLPAGKSVPSIDAIRSCFPTLDTDFVFLENAGGSQVPSVVTDAIREYMLTHYVQVGAGYPASAEATAVVAQAHEFMETWVNARDTGKVVLGPSSTALVNIVANAYADVMESGDEFIICDANHEANAGPWDRLSKRGAVIKRWRLDAQSLECSLTELDTLITPRTKLVAFPHVSNLLGEVVDVPAITKFVHDRGAKVFVDGVAYAPHGLIDVAAWGVDWYVLSNYKVYGPHMATLFGRFDAFEGLTGPNHFFIADDALPYKWELGSINHEGCSGLVALHEYASFLAGGATGRDAVVGACTAMEALEQPLAHRLIQYLEGRSDVRLIGAGSKRRSVGTVSFIPDKIACSAVADAFAARGIGIRSGHMYAVRLCEAAGIPLDEGVVRISMLHYNTMAEIEQAIAVLDDVL